MVEYSSTPSNANAGSYQGYLGAIIGDYRLQQLLETTEIGPTFLARNEAKQVSVRLRLLTVPPDLSSEDRIIFLGRFQQEANRVIGLRHVHLQPLLGYGIHQKLPYLVTPYEKLKTFSAFLREQGLLDPLLASRYLDQVTDALEYLHGQAVLHLNLSAASILLKEDGSLLITDTGIARMLATGENLASAQGKQEAQESRFVLRDMQGRPRYVFGAESAPAPEQLLDRPLDAATDVYGLGALLYRMLTGHRVFRAGNSSELARQHLNDPVPSLSTWRNDVPKSVDQIIEKAMSKEAAQRFRQPGTLANAYHDAIAPHDTQRKAFVTGSPSLRTISSTDAADARRPLVPPIAARVSPQSGASKQVGISRRRAIALMAGGGAVAVVAVTLFASHYLTGNTAPSTPVANSGPTKGATAPTSSKTSTSPGHTGTVLARTSDVPVNSAKQFPIPNNNNNPGLLIHLPNNNFVAFNSTCTHAGCAVNYNPQDHLLECPCHQAVFDPSKGAAVVSGPAPSPLASIPITINADNTITTSS